MKKTIFSLPILFLLAIGGAHGDTRSSVGVGFAMLSSEEDGINNIGLVYAYQQNNLVIDIGVFGGGSDAEVDNSGSINYGASYSVDTFLSTSIKYGRQTENVFPYLSLGYSSASVSYSATACYLSTCSSASDSDSGGGATIGAGAKFNFNEKWGINANINRLFGDFEDTNLFNILLEYSF